MFKSQSVYILHGWSVSSENKTKWKNFISLLEDKQLTVHFLGIPGLSSPLDEVWQLDDFVKWLGTQLPAGEQVILLGHSFGGQISSRFTALYPERIKALILIDSAGIRDHAFIPTIKRNVFWITAKIGKLLLPFSFFKTLLYTLARERDYINAPPLLKRTMSAVLDREIINDLPKISCPTLIIWGEDDRVTPYKLSLQFKDTIKNSRLVTVQNARHSPQFTHTHETAKAVTEFIETL